MSNRILKVSRLEGLTDGIFAIAMTILILELHLPSGISDKVLPLVLIHNVVFRLFIYIGSFIILGTLWIAMNFQLGLLAHVTRPYLWANVFYLMVICVVPFSASLVGSYPNHPASIIFFACNLMFASLMQFITAESAHKRHLNNESYVPEMRRAILRRIFVGPIFYVAGILLAYWSPTFAFILLICPPLIYLAPGKIDTFDK